MRCGLLLAATTGATRAGGVTRKREEFKQKPKGWALAPKGWALAQEDGL